MAETTLEALRKFIQDAGELAQVVGEDFDE